MNRFSIVMTTCADEGDARPIIDALLQERLAACVQVVPIHSHYIWDGAVRHEGEVLLMIKGKTENYEAIERTILSLHGYEVPEIILVPIEGGDGRYLSWLADPQGRCE